MRICLAGTGVLAVLCALTLSACTTTTDAPEEAPVSIIQTGSLAASVRGARSVAIHPTGRVIRVVDSVRNAELRAAMDNAILDTFRAQGYRTPAANMAERLVAYAIGVTGELEDDELASTFGITAGMRLGAGDERGAIVLVVVNAQTGQVEWRSSASAPNDNPSDTPDVTSTRIRRAIEKMLAELPQR